MESPPVLSRAAATLPLRAWVRMHTLRLLGGFALLDPHGNPVHGLAPRRAEAVLALLALAGDLGCTRDRLIGLLWPESDESHARHNLRNVLHAIHVAVGPDAVLVSGDTLKLNPAVIDADVQRFAESIASAQWEEAAHAYRGPLLDGLHVDDAREFDRWMEKERARLYRECADAMETLAQQAEGQSGPHGGAAWWARAADHDPYNSRLAIRLMRSLAALGDRANALLHAEAHRKRLWRDLQIAPDARFEEEVERLRVEQDVGHAGAERARTSRPGPA